jgi:predicted RNase H-like HicB family nuclease
MRKTKLEEVEYLIRITLDEDGYYAEAPDLPGCSTSAETFETLLDNVREAVPSYLGSLRKHREPIPAPSHRQVRVKSGLIYASVRVAA